MFCVIWWFYWKVESECILVYKMKMGIARYQYAVVAIKLFKLNCYKMGAFNMCTEIYGHTFDSIDVVLGGFPRWNAIFSELSEVS